MKLKPGFEEEYKKRHDAIWPDLESELVKAGINEYAIFLDDETGILFAYQKLNDNHTTTELPTKPVMKKWWDFMKDIMEVNPDHSPVINPLTKVFDLG